MNIFFLSISPQEAARMMCDKHVVKMILELCQMLWTAFHSTGEDQWKELVPAEMKIYRATHANHPTCVWVRSSSTNYKWAAEHALEISKEYTRRYGKIHACHLMAEWFTRHSPRCDCEDKTQAVYATKDIPDGCTPAPLCITNSEYHRDSLVESYRVYYIKDKIRFAKWDKSNNTPDWFLKG